MEKHRIRFSDNEIAAFCGQLTYVMRAGVSLEEGLLLMEEELDRAEGKALVAEMRRTMEDGGTFAAALKKAGAFPGYMVHMAQIGEASGRLEEVLHSLTAYYERQETVARAIKSSVSYPLVMIAMMIAVIFVIIIAVLPVFQDVLQQLGGGLSGIAAGLMQFGQAVSASAVVIIIVAAALLVLYFVLRKTQGGRRFLSGMTERMFRKTAAAVSAGRFASALAMMLGSGMDVDEALALEETLMESGGAKKKIAQMRAAMEKGESFADAVAHAGMFSGLQAKMITVGFKTGTLEEVMRQIARQYEEEADRRMDAVVSALEPTLVAVLALIVGLILLSVMLPLMGVMSAIG
ncbi:MAG: type II secretion system F family protein [Christensenella sp.]|nr:type II secretion system F family protein [Christensenella sp.]